MNRLRTPMLILIFLVVFICGFFLSWSDDLVPLKFGMFETPAVSLFVWIIIAFFVGGLVTLASAFWVGIKRRMENRRLRTQLAQAQAEIERLRDLTLQAPEQTPAAGDANPG